VRKGVRSGFRLTLDCLTGALTRAAPAPMVRREGCCPELHADAGLASARAFLYCSNFAMYSACRDPSFETCSYSLSSPLVKSNKTITGWTECTFFCIKQDVHHLHILTMPRCVWKLGNKISIISQCHKVKQQNTKMRSVGQLTLELVIGLGGLAAVCLPGLP